MTRNVLVLLVAAFLLSGCRSLNPSVMFQTDAPPIPVDDTSMAKKDFVFTPQDRFEMKVYTNDGFSMVDVTQNTLNIRNESISYRIEKDSLVKLPLLGKINLTGMTMDSARTELEKLYSQYFNDPFVVLKITSRVVYVFLGEGGQGRVVNLEDDHTSLIEALAIAGGINERGKAYKIKIIRGNLKNPQVYFVDLSTMDGVKKSNLYVQSNDIVYIEPSTNVAEKLTNQITPFLALITTVLLVVSLVQN